MSESAVQMLLELQQLGAVPTALGRLFQTPPSSGEEPFPNTQPDPPLTQLHAVPLGPVAVTESRAQHCPSAPLLGKDMYGKLQNSTCSVLLLLATLHVSAQIPRGVVCTM